MLSIEPLPSVNKAFYLVQLVGKQRQVVDMVDLIVEWLLFISRRMMVIEYNKKRRKGKRLFYKHCRNDGHSVENCF